MRERVMNIIRVFFLVYLFIIFSCLQPEVQDDRNVISVLAYGENSGIEEILFLEALKEMEEIRGDYHFSFEILNGEMFFRRAKQMVSSGNIPDIFYGGPDTRWGALWAESDLQFDHRPYLDAGHYNLSMIPHHGPHGEIYNIPLGSTNITSVLYVNQSLLDQLGLPLPETYGDLVAMVPLVQGKGLDVVTFNGQDDWAWGACFLSTYAGRFTGDPLFTANAAWGESSYTDPGFIAALTAVDTWVRDGVFPSDVLTTGYDENIRNFSEGRALFMLQGQWVTGAIDIKTARNTLMMALPSMDNEVPTMGGYCAGALAVGYGMSRTAGDDPIKREICLEFLRLLNSSARAAERLEAGEILAPIVRDVPMPDHFQAIHQQKVEFVLSLTGTIGVIDAFANEDANHAVNNGAQYIAAGFRTPQDVAEEVERLARQ